MSGIAALAAAAAATPKINAPGTPGAIKVVTPQHTLVTPQGMRVTPVQGRLHVIQRDFTASSHGNHMLAVGNGASMCKSIINS